MTARSISQHVVDLLRVIYICFFFFNDTATTEIYTLSLHDALPILITYIFPTTSTYDLPFHQWQIIILDRKSTRLNSSHVKISYAVFCLKKKKHGLVEERLPNLVELLRGHKGETAGC